MKKHILYVITLLVSQFVYCQNTGLIFQPASTVLGKSVLDPNNDGYTSVTTTGFVGTDYGVQSELKMIKLPYLVDEPFGDIVTGATGGHTDIVSAGSGNSVYVLTKNVGGIDYFIVRFRIGATATSNKGYSLLLDTDGNFGTMLSSNNPGYDLEVCMQTGNQGAVVVYKHTASQQGQVFKTYTLSQYSQRSIALSTVNGNADYFYDFFVPLSDIGGNNPVRITAVTINNASSGLVGTVSDFNGINDKSYNNSSISLMSTLINSFPAISLDQLTENFNPSSWLPKTTTPTVNTPLNAGETSISGTSKEPNGTKIYIYKNSVLIDSTTVTNESWSKTISPALVINDTISAKAIESTKTLSDLSNKVIAVKVSPCYSVPPVILNHTNSGNKILTISWTPPNGFINTGSNVRIKVYEQTAMNTFNFVYDLSPLLDFQYYPTSSTLMYALDGSGGVAGTFLATATYNGCESSYSNTYINGNTGNGTTTIPDSIVTPSIIASANSQAIIVQNKHTASVKMYYYLNGKLIDSSVNPTNVSASGRDTFYVAGLNPGDILTSRAQGLGTTDRLSSSSNELIVQSNVQTTAPTITGNYSACSNASCSVSGRSDELPGTRIDLYINGVFKGRTTVDNAGNWTVSVDTLKSGQVLTAKALASGKNESNFSNSVTVTQAPPVAPVITTSSIIANTTTTIGGTLAATSADSVVLYVDDARIGKAGPLSGTNPITWSVPNLDKIDIYKNGVVTAYSFRGGSRSTVSNSVTIIGPDSFRITAPGNVALGNQVAGVPFPIEVRAFRQNSAFNDYVGRNMFSSQSIFLSGNGPSNNFNTGLLTPHSLTLQTAGSYPIITVAEDDPTAKGSSSVLIVVPNVASKIRLRTRITDTALYTQTFNRQPIVEITDGYGNFIDSSRYDTVSITISIKTGSGQIIGTKTINFSNGVANFSGLKIDTVGDFVAEFTPSNKNFQAVLDTFVARGYTWYGGTSTDFNTASNWLDNSVPVSGARIEFHPTPVNHCIMDQNRTIGDIKNGSNKYLDLNGFTLTLQGKLLFSNNAVIKGNTGNSKMILKANSIQTIEKPTFVNNTINNLQMENPAGVTLAGANNELIIGNNLNFVLGKFDATGNGNLITFNDNATHSNVTSSKYIVGACKKIGNDSFMFPIGKGNKYAPCKISAPSSISDYFTAEYFASNHPNTSKKNQNAQLNKSILQLSRKEYWNIDRSGSSSVDVTLFWYDATFSEIKTINGLTVAHFDGTDWEIPTTNPSVTPTIDSINNLSGSVTFPAVNSFSPFTFGGTTNMVGLPIELNYFEAICHSDYTQINWTTASEKNNEFFELYKSEDAVNWEKIHIAKGQGTKATETHYTFNDVEKTSGYYRLKDIDESGIENWSNIIAASCSDYVPLETTLYPNPAQDYVIINTTFEENSNYKIVDMKGKELLVGKIFSEKTMVSINDLLSGVYVLEINKNGTYVHRKLIKK